MNPTNVQEINDVFACLLKHGRGHVSITLHSGMVVFGILHSDMSMSEEQEYMDRGCHFTNIGRLALRVGPR